jgi:sporulation protein YlmC with PRC-barrel domain
MQGDSGGQGQAGAQMKMQGGVSGSGSAQEGGMQPPPPPPQAGGQSGMQMQGGAMQPPPAGGQGGAQMQGSAATESDATGSAPKITVQEQPAQIKVEKQQPRVVVQQPSPEVSIQQPEPRVTVQQNQPQVQVREAPPQVSVQEQGQPRVQVQQSGQPQVQVRQSDQPAATRQQPATGSAQGAQYAAGAAASASEGLMNKTAGELKGTEIVDARGEELGKVDKVVIDRATGQPHVVLEVGGFLGIGDEAVTLPLDNMSLLDGKLAIPGHREEEQMKKRPQYREEEYVEVKRESTLASALGATGNSAPQQSASANFGQLDQNGDGYLSPAEASSDIRQNWQQLDRNHDGAVDTTEFSAFESGGSVR